MIQAAIVGLGRWGRTLVASMQGKSDKLRFTTGVSRDPARVREVLWPRARTPLVRHMQLGIPIAILATMVLLVFVGLLVRNKELFRTLLAAEGVIVFLLMSLSSAIQAALQWIHSQLVAAYTLTMYLVSVAMLPFVFLPWLVQFDLRFFTLLLIGIVLALLRGRLVRKLVAETNGSPVPEGLDRRR